MLRFVVILALAAFATASPINQTLDGVQRLDGRIVGGKETTIYAAPYQVSLQKFGQHTCGGSIIGKVWVVTAGHCVGSRTSSYQLRTGSTNFNSGGSVHRVQQIIRHRNYGTNIKGTTVNDIALIRVYDFDAFNFNNARKAVKLYEGNSATLVGQSGTITGWGVDEHGTVSTVLREVSVPLISKKQCNEYYRKEGGVPTGEICAGLHEGGKDSCQGDSGGPMTVNGKLVGIVSWGLGCGTPKYPGVYTDVSYYRNWIRQNSGI